MIIVPKQDADPLGTLVILLSERLADKEMELDAVADAFAAGYREDSCQWVFTPQQLELVDKFRPLLALKARRKA